MRDSSPSIEDVILFIVFLGTCIMISFMGGADVAAIKQTRKYCEELVLLEPKVKPVILEGQCWVTIQDTGLHMKREDFLKRFAGK